MKTFKVIVKQLVPNEQLDGDDFQDNPSGYHFVTAEDKESALDEFHWTVPIACLDDFEISIEEAQ